MPNTTSKINTIAKNTGLLYIRMFFILLVSLFTSRIVLQTLGVEDYGLYNVVGSVISSFLFINMAISASTQRYLTFELGKGNNHRLKQLFSATLNIHTAIAILVFVLSETIGLWFLYNYLNIPENRFIASLWVYQFSVFTALISIIQVPFNATIISHEKMGIYAYFSIFEVSLNLLLVYLLTLIDYDKMKVYAILIFILKFGIAYLYRLYCKNNFKECSYIKYSDKKTYKELIIFSGWSMIGNMSVIAKGHGVNILLNLFFGPVLNTAMAISTQVSNAATSFFSNFQMAVNPQIIKSHAEENSEYMMSLIFKSSKFSFYLLFLFSLPVLLETDFILSLWLGHLPQFATVFTILAITNILIDSISGSLVQAAHAYGKIKKYQIIVGGSLILSLPISYAFLKFGYPPESALYVGILTSLIALILRLILLKQMINLSIKEFISQVLNKIILVIIISSIVPILIYLKLDKSILRFLLVILSSTISVLCTVYLIGINSKEKQIFNSLISKKIKFEK